MQIVGLQGYLFSMLVDKAISEGSGRPHKINVASDKRNVLPGELVWGDFIPNSPSSIVTSEHLTHPKVTEGKR